MTTKPRRRRPSARLKATALAGVALLAAAACGAPANSGGSGTFSLGIAVPLVSADPYAANTGSGQMFYLDYLAYDSLLNPKDDGTFASGLAQKWTADADSASFTLRPDVTCSDGSHLTASQVAADLTFVGDPGNQYPNYGNLTPSVPYTVHGDDATGAVTVKASSPFPFLLETLGEVPIVCAQGMKNRSMLATKTSGTGPYVLTATSQNSYTYEVRKDYRWGPGGAATSAPATAQKVVVNVVTNSATAANELLAGQLTASHVLGSDSKRLLAAGFTQPKANAQAAGLYFTESAQEATSDVSVRQALAAAMDFGQLTKVQSIATGQPAARSTGVRSGTPLPCAGADARKFLPSFDLARAGQLLDQAGWAKGPGGGRAKNGKPLSLTIAYQHDTESSLAELLQEQWQKLGAKVSLDLLTTQQKQAFINGSANFSVLIAASALTLPTQFQAEVSGPGAPSGFNLQQVSNPDYDRLAAQAIKLTGAAGCAKWVEAENTVLARADVIPVADQPFIIFTSKSAHAEWTSLRQPVPTSLRLG